MGSRKTVHSLKPQTPRCTCDLLAQPACCQLQQQGAAGGTLIPFTHSGGTCTLTSVNYTPPFESLRTTARFSLHLPNNPEGLSLLLPALKVQSSQPTNLACKPQIYCSTSRLQQRSTALGQHALGFYNSFSSRRTEYHRQGRGLQGWWAAFWIWSGQAGAGIRGDQQIYHTSGPHCRCRQNLLDTTRPEQRRKS